MFPFPFSSRPINDSDRRSSWDKKRTSRPGVFPSSGTSTPSHTWGSQSSLADSLQSTASNVAWQGGNPLISLPLTAQGFDRSSLSPAHSPVGPARTNKVYKHSSFQTTHTQSAKLDPRVVSGSDDGYLSAGSKPLSPIVEQDYFSPEGRSMPLPVEHTTELQICTPGGSEFSDTPRTYS